ncbi:hypothetical protein EGR_04580 [Echinococcus granulosus]|uniref:Uncharacterized protein n=1 Tax=Echinococcus granulosus TaxID=6210 RepID=W6UHM7_ECHGR|nr:hypothetical protein EGR_04580 [Echinococcus granulosus]EUB60561.1 hypothetical protein EGR_04580 [Echinococcus granulosus]
MGKPMTVMDDFSYMAVVVMRSIESEGALSYLCWRALTQKPGTLQASHQQSLSLSLAAVVNLHNRISSGLNVAEEHAENFTCLSRCAFVGNEIMTRLST